MPQLAAGNPDPLLLLRRVHSTVPNPRAAVLLFLWLGHGAKAMGAARSPSRQTARGQSRPPPRRPSPRAVAPRPSAPTIAHGAPQLPAGLRPLAQTAAPPQCRTLPAPACRAPLAAPCRLARTSQAPALQAAGHRLWPSAPPTRQVPFPFPNPKFPIRQSPLLICYDCS